MRSTCVVSLALVLTLCWGCQSGPERSLRIGAKPFAEQAILAEVLRHVAMESHVDAEVVTCNDSFDCHRRLREDQLDLMVEYSGTALQFVGGVAPDRSDPSAQVRRLFRPLGLRWLDPLGFDNTYCILVPINQGATQGIATIADLAQMPDGIRIATPPEFLRRSRDGLQAMLRFYGLRLADEPLVIADPVDRFHALRDGRADVAVGYATDGSINSLGLTTLSDPLGFFPPYEAAIVVREEVWENHRQLGRALEALSGRFPTEVMRELNSAVQVDGDAPETAALRFLEHSDVLEQQAATSAIKRVPPVVVSFAVQDHLNTETARALRALRHLFPDRPLRRKTDVSNPLEAVAAGRANFAVVGAERFFQERPRRRPLPVEAVAVLGTRFVHLLRPSDQPPGPTWRGRIGLQPAESSGGAIGKVILDASNATAAVRGDTKVLLAALESGEIDSALVVTEANATELARPLSRGGIRLESVGAWLTPTRSLRTPYLRRARIPTGTYAHQDAPIDTMSVQVVLVGPARARGTTTGPAGPAAALPLPMRPLTTAQLDRLSESTGILELPDAVLPSPWTTRLDDQESREQTGSSILETVLNVLVIAFIVWIVVLVLRKHAPAAEG